MHVFRSMQRPHINSSTTTAARRAVWAGAVLGLALAWQPVVLAEQAADPTAAEEHADPLSPAERKAFEGRTLVRVSHASRSLIDELHEHSADIWTHMPMVGRPIDAAVTHQHAAAMVERGLAVEVLIEDLAAHYAEIRRAINQRVVFDGDPTGPGVDETDWYGAYRSLSEFRVRWERIERLHPGLVSSEPVGLSIEGREIRAYRLSGEGDPTTKPAIVVIGGTHAREWSAHMATTWAMEHLATTYGADPRTTRLLDEIQFVFVPMLNPDGYKYSFEEDGWWRKNRRGDGTTVWGVDPNRNYSVSWGTGVSHSRGSEVYPGEAPFSEPETAALRDFLLPMAGRVRGLIDVHGSANALYAPWSHSGLLPEERPVTIIDASARMATAVTRSARTSFRWEVPGSYGGTSKDWGFDELGALSWTFEIGPTGSHLGEGLRRWGRGVHASLLELADYVTRPVQLAVAVDSRGRPLQDKLETRDGRDWLVVPIEASDGTGEFEELRAFQRLRDSDEYIPAVVEHVSGVQYEVLLGPLGCDGYVEGFYLEATTTDGRVTRAPESGEMPVVLASYFEHAHRGRTSTYWVVGDPGDTATTGIWDRNGAQATPYQPGDVNGWVTGREATTPVEDGMVNGRTTLVANGFNGPSWMAQAASATLTANVWAVRPPGAAGSELVISAAAADGTTQWHEIGRVAADDELEWTFHEFLLPSTLVGRGTLDFRFEAGVGQPGSEGLLAEYLIDRIWLVYNRCDGHPGDFNGDGALDVFDLLAFQDAFQARDPRADLDRDGLHTVFDFLTMLHLLGV